MGEFPLIGGCLFALCLEGLLHCRELGVAIEGLINDLLHEFGGRARAMYERGCFQERIALGAESEVGLGVAAGHLG